MKQYTIKAEFDPEARVWCGSNEELPLTTEAPTLDLLLARAAEIGPEIAVMNGLAESGEEVTFRLAADRIAAMLHHGGTEVTEKEFVREARLH